MEPIDLFSLVPHPGPYETWPASSQLLMDGRPTGRTVPGHAIEAQYAVPGGRFLLAISQDCPHEESNDFLLLDPDLRLLSTRSIGRPYQSYLITEHAPLDADEPTVRFVTANGLEVLVAVRPRRPLGLGPLLRMSVRGL